MMNHTAGQLARLRAGPAINYLIKFAIDGTTYCLTDGDVELIYNGDTYVPGFINDQNLPEIEVTSDPKTNDLDIPIEGQDSTFVGEFLGSKWMNARVTIFKHFHDDQGEIITKNAFQGLFSDAMLKESDRTVVAKVSSVWADFEKRSGIRTNLKSQQRFYPTDTAFRHSAQAIKKIYWGKDAPENNRSRSSGGSAGGNTGIYTKPQ